MGFSAPSLLFGMLGALVPLILHLLFRKKPEVVSLPTLRFVRLANQKVLRRHKLRRKLLLLVRMLLVGLTALAMSRPFLQETTSSVTSQLQGDVIIVVDNSYFTQATTPEGSVLDRARRLANPLVEKATNRVSVILTCPMSNQEQLPLSADTRKAYAFLEGMESANRFCSLTDAVDKASQRINDIQQEQTESSVLVLSSQRRLSTLTTTNAPGQRYRVIALDILDGLSIENAAIVNLDARQAPELGADFWQVNAEVAYFGTQDRGTELTLTIPPDLELKVPITLKPGANVFKTFQFAKSFKHAVKGTVALTQDQLTYDDAAAFWLTSNNTINVLAINGGFSPQPQDDELFYLERALGDGTTNGDEFDVQSMTVETWTPKQWRSPNVVVLANVNELPETLTHKLQGFVLNGGGLLVSLGDQVNPDRMNRQLARLLPRKIRGFRKAGDAAASDHGKDRKPSRLEVFEESHAVFRHITSPTDTSISKALVVNYGLFTTNASESVDELISLDEGAPLLISANKGQGKVMVLATSLDRQWTDLSIQPDFVPLINGIMRYLSGIKAQQTQILTNGTSLKLSYPPEEGLRFDLELPGGTQRSINLPNDDERWRTITGIDDTGHYTLTDTGATTPRVTRFSVLPNTEASDFTVNKAQSSSGAVNSSITSNSATPTNIWPFILLILFVLLATEGRLADWFNPEKENLAQSSRR
jgi:hypothetical protein